jgi:hypothetical protein
MGFESFFFGKGLVFGRSKMLERVGYGRPGQGKRESEGVVDGVWQTQDTRNSWQSTLVAGTSKESIRSPVAS